MPGLFFKILNSGVQDNLPFSEQKRIRLLNQINFIIALFILGAGITLYFIAVPRAKIFLLHSNLTFSGLLLFSIYLNYLRKTEIARLITLIVSPVIVLLVSIAFGTNAKVIFLFFVTATLPLVFYSNKYVIFLYWAINFFLFILSIWYHTRYIPIFQRDDAPYLFEFFLPVFAFILLAATVLIFKNENIRNESELQKQNELIKKQSSELKKLDEVKSRLYANISHEFRTPLTLISIPIQDLLNSENDPSRIITYKRVLDNCNQLIGLVNQVLDLSKLDAGEERMYIHNLDLVGLVKTSFASFESLAKSRQINFLLDCKPARLIAAIDSDKIKVIINNLLLNAFKFTPDGGEIVLKLKYKDNLQAEITVSDSGRGIPKQEIPLIFDRFYHLENSQTGASASSGIGLEIAHELVDLHGGTITVESELGVGSCFTVRLMAKSVFYSSEMSEEKENMQAKEFFKKENTCTKVEDIFSLERSQKRVLIVEDNRDMRLYLKEFLSENFYTIEAENGEVAFEKAFEFIPDIIISDVMMPKMDGIEFCRKIRDTEITQHIPLLMLTAKSDKESKIDGLDSGADYYLEKPFILDELKIMLANLVKRQEQLHEYYKKIAFQTNSPSEEHKIKDVFLDKFNNYIEENILISNLNINKLGLDLGYSRSQLYRKTKALTNLSPNEYVRHIRLKKAAQLLKNGYTSISEVCYAVGFNKHSYFSECFRTLYSCTPSEYVGKYNL